MEEKTLTKAHKVALTNRENASVTGVLDVISFDIAEILLEIELGMLHMKGKDLHVTRLNLEKGEVDVEGLMEAITYSQIPSGLKKNDSLLGKLFR